MYLDLMFFYEMFDFIFGIVSKNGLHHEMLVNPLFFEVSGTNQKAEQVLI